MKITLGKACPLGGADLRFFNIRCNWSDSQHYNFKA